VGKQALQVATSTLLGTILGLALPAFYLIPAAYQRRFVQIKMAILPGMRFSDNFLFRRIGDLDHDTVLHTASLVAVIMIALTATALLFVLKRTPRAPGLRALTFLALIIILLLTPLSAPIWSHTPDLLFLQFPWRLLAVLAAIFGLALAEALSTANPPRTTAIAALVITVVFTLPAYHLFRQQCWPEDTVPRRLATFLAPNPGTDPTDEYTPINADNDTLAQNNPPYWLAAIPNAPAPNNNPAQNPGPASRTFDLNLVSPKILILNLRDYPAWRITINNAPAPPRPHREDGLIAIPLPAGPSHIRIVWHTTTDHLIGSIISILSLALITLIWFRNRMLSKHMPLEIN